MYRSMLRRKQSNTLRLNIRIVRHGIIYVLDDCPSSKLKPGDMIDSIMVIELKWVHAAQRIFAFCLLSALC